MIAEALLWTGIALAAPLLVGFYGERLERRLGDWAPACGSAGRWINNLGIPYVALMSGAIIPREVGLTGTTGAEWLRGGMVCVGVMGIAWIVVRRPGMRWTYAAAERAALDESRWALYRGTGSLLTDPRWAGPLIGLGLGLLEWFLGHRLWAHAGRPAPMAWADLARVCASTALFLLTRNLWLIVLTQAGLSLLFSSRIQGTSEDAA